MIKTSQFLARLIGLAAPLGIVSLGAAHAQGDTRLFLAGTEPPNADMSYVELTWLPDARGIAPGLTSVVELDGRVPLAMETCASAQGMELKVATTDNVFGGFALQLGFDSADNDAFPDLLACILPAVAALKPEDQVFLLGQQTYYDNVGFLDYVFSLMTQFGYGLAQEEFADPVLRPSELYSLTLEDYRNAWPSLLEASDLYAVVVAPTGVVDLLVAIDEQIDKTPGRPDQAILPEQPPYTAAPLEGLGVKVQGASRSIFQVNRVFAPSLVASLSEGQVFGFIVDQRLNAFREAEGLDPVNDLFVWEPDEAEVAAAEAAGEDPPSPPLPLDGLAGVLSSFFADGQHVASFTFMSVYQGPQPFAPTLDRQVAAIEQAMTAPFTETEFADAVANLRRDDCAPEPTENMAQIQSMWLREDLFHGRAKTFLIEDVMGCDSLTLDRANEVRVQALTNSATLFYGFGNIQEDAETLARPFCLVEDVGQLEFECSASEYEL